jgi:hypothetical protein
MLGPPAAGLIIYLATAFTWLYVAGFGFSWWASFSRTRWLLLAYAVVLAGAWVWVWWWLKRPPPVIKRRLTAIPDKAVLLDLNARSFKADEARLKEKRSPILAGEYRRYRVRRHPSEVSRCAVVVITAATRQ